jgi:hypothetical protein
MVLTCSAEIVRVFLAPANTSARSALTGCPAGAVRAETVTSLALTVSVAESDADYHDNSDKQAAGLHVRFRFHVVSPRIELRPVYPLSAVTRAAFGCNEESDSGKI